MIKVRVQGILSVRRALGKAEINVDLNEGSCLQDLLGYLGERLGGDFTELVFDCRGRPAAYCRFLINGRDIQFLNGLDTVLAEGDTITIIPPIAGG